MEEKIRVLISEEDVNAKILEVAAQINKDYAGKPIHLVCILKGAAMFMCELAKRLSGEVVYDFMRVSSYGNATVSSGNIKILSDLDEDIHGENLILVEDIIDTGKTLKKLIEIFEQRGAKSIKVCALLNKPSRRTEKAINVDYECFEIPDAFVVGYGLDYDQKYRNLPYIGVVEFADQEDKH